MSNRTWLAVMVCGFSISDAGGEIRQLAEEDAAKIKAG